MRPSVHPSPLPFTFDSAVDAQGGFGARGLFGDTKQRPIHSNPAHRLQQKNHPASSACGSALLQSLSLIPLSFCVAVIYSNTISPSSSSSFYSSLRFSNPPHHPPIIFRALSWLSLPKPSGLIVWSRGIESAGWNEKWGFLSATTFILFSFSLSFVSPLSPIFFPFQTLFPTPHQVFTSHIHSLLCWLFHSSFFTSSGLPQPANLTPFLFSFPFISALRPLLALTGSRTGMGICKGSWERVGGRDQRVRL